MSPWLVISIIGVVVAGILAGLVINHFILRIKRKNSLLVSNDKVPAFNSFDESRNTISNELREINVREINTNPVIPIDQGASVSFNQTVTLQSIDNNVGEERPEALIELEKNLAIASKPVNGTLESFQTAVWDTRRTDFSVLTTEVRYDLTEAYVDMRLANNIVWLVTELGRTSPDLAASYQKLCSKISERLQQILPRVRQSFQ